MPNLWKKTRGFKLPFIGLIALGFALTSVLSRAQTPPKIPDAPPPQKSYEQAVAGIGIIEPKGEVTEIGTEIGGLVAQVHVRAGDEIKAGTPLFSLDMRDIDAQIKRLEAAVETARIGSEDAADKHKIVRDVRNPQSVSKDERNRARFADELARAQLNETTAFLEQAKTVKQRMTITAPITGTVLDVNIRAGEYAPSGTTAEPLIRMGDMSTLYVRVEIDEENAARLNKEAKAEGVLRGMTQGNIPLKFSHIEPFVQAKQNLAVSGQRVDTRVLQILYILPPAVEHAYPGRQMDVFIEEKTPTAQ